MFTLTVAAGQVALSQEWGLTNSPDLVPQRLVMSADGTVLLEIGNQPGTDSATAPWFLYASTNLGATWKLVTSPAQRISSIAVSADGTKWLAEAGSVVDLQGHLYISTNLGNSWTQTSAPVDFYYLDAAAITISADGTRMAACGKTNIYVSFDSGATWTNGATALDSCGFYRITSSGDGINLAAIAGCPAMMYLLSSTDSGYSWTDSQPYFVGTGDIRYSPDGTKLIYAIDWLGIYISTNSGGDWTPTSADISIPWTRVACSADGTTLIAGSRFPTPTNFVTMSTNGGASWMKANLPETNSWHVACSADGTKLAAASQAGLYIWAASASVSPPTLTVLLSGASLNFYWSGVAGFVLQENSSVTGPDWRDVSVVPTHTNLQFTAVIARPADNRFYRLIFR
jgi:hypothetical protein